MRKGVIVCDLYDIEISSRKNYKALKRVYVFIT